MSAAGLPGPGWTKCSTGTQHDGVQTTTVIAIFALARANSTRSLPSCPAEAEGEDPARSFIMQTARKSLDEVLAGASGGSGALRLIATCLECVETEYNNRFIKCLHVINQHDKL